MLYRKTTQAVSAAILAVMALLGVSAHAVINLDARGGTASPVGTVTFSKETLGALTAPATHHPLMVDETDAAGACAAPSSTSTSTRLAVRVGLGMRIAQDQTRFVRLDLTNMRFRTAITDSFNDVCLITQGGPDHNRTLEVGGQKDGNFVIFGITATGGDAQASWPVYFALHDLLEIQTGATEGSISYSAYADVGTAVGRTNALKTASKTGVAVRTSVTTKVTPGTSPAVANVATDPRFTDFVGGGRQPLGTVTVTLNKTHLKSVAGGGLVATLGDVRRSGTVTLTAAGGLEFGTFSMHPGSDCTGTAAGVRVATTGETKGQGTVSVAEGARTLCVARRTVDHDKDRTTPAVPQVIPETSISAAVNYVKNATAHFPPANLAAMTIGSIERNGTTVRLPFLTTFENYNNRIVIVNRGNVPADYELMFTTEDAVTATPGHMAEGTVPANATMVIKVADAVTLEGGTRTAATLAVVAPETLVDVATTIVNKMDQSTDTVTYDVQ